MHMFLKKFLTNSRLTLISIVVFAIAVRYLGFLIPAQPYDIGTYHAWGNHMLSVGPARFYENIWCDYMPLPVLTFAIPAALTSYFSFNFSLMFKLLHTIIELGLLYAILAKIKTPRYLPLVILLILSPATILNTSYWGQVDALPSLLSLLALTTLSLGKNSWSAAVYYGLAVAYKPIMLLLSPLLWVVAIKQKKGLSFPLVSSLTFFITALPFVARPLDTITLMWHRAIEQAGTYPYLSINAWNLWTTTGNTSWIPDTTSVFSLSGHTLGLTLFALGSILLARAWYTRSFPLADAPYLASLILMLFYAVTTRMHERHLLFGLPFLAYSVISFPKYFRHYLILLTCYVLNLYSAYYWVLNGQIFPFPPLVTIICSWATVLTILHLILSYLFPNYFERLLIFFRSNRIFAIIIILASLLRLVNLSHPQTYIFDEVYHAFTAKEFLHNNISAWEWWTTPPPGVAYEWTHPPVAKYGMVLGMLIVGENSLGYRLFSAIFGVVAVVLIYFLVFRLTNQKNTALLSAFLLAIEGTHIAQSRIAMNDSYLIMFYLSSLLSAVNNRWKLASILFGLALGSKWSALYGLLPLALVFLNQYWPRIRQYPLTILFSLRYLIIALITYILTFTPFILAPHTWAQWWELQRQMWYYHTGLVATHGYQSVPLQWIFAARPVWYWVDYGQNIVSNIYVQGNPIILWFGLFVLLAQIRKLFTYPYLIFYSAYTAFVFPWIFSPRIMFYYHYLPSSVFLVTLIATYLADLPKKSQRVFLLIAIAGLILIAPMLYGIPVSTKYWDTFFKIFPTWK